MLVSTLFALSTLTSLVLAGGNACRAVVSEVDIDDHKYKYFGLVGHATYPADARDEYGDTIGGWGSAIAADLDSWEMEKDGSYSGIIYGIPDRGWNTNGSP